MRHLHLEFICAGFSLGLGIFLLGVSGWQVSLLLNSAHGVVLPIWLTTAMSVFVAGTLLVHAFDGIRREVTQPRHPHHVL